ncbi:PucR family transcriptional regulator [Nocardia colli]|uniref:PucR family transcriptional regulator n=1 Tax=Nocardia colli TaxID=2545717 RepID=A0A5N0EIJ9_9NOCA|nr:helix-turn-helix domain-containing protein [Nocardia colli]KAA8889102.1 PucR family transcriptional regulator [Nocardia colli]
MAVDSPIRPNLTISGKPMSTPLRDVRALSRQMVGHFVENVVPCGTLPGEAIYGDVTTITRVCLELAASMLDGHNIPAKVEQLEEAAAGWAREGVPIDAIHNAIHAGFQMGMDLVVSNLTVKDLDNFVDGSKLNMEILHTLTSAISRAYFRELRAAVSEHHTAVHTLTSALLGGRPTSTMARECGIAIAESYAVLAVSIPRHRDERNPALNTQVVARRKLRRTQAELAARCGGNALSLLSIDGGTILLPADQHPDEQLDALIEGLSQAAQVGITATFVQATPEQIPGAVDQAHELLDMVHRLHCVTGLYRFDELALEYQLTRPGPGREYLGAVLTPLDEHTELLETLQMHISNNLNRQRTARALHVHTNTVDYRLKRIGQLTGFDPSQPSGLWYLRSALIARSYHPTDPTNRQAG